MNQRNALLVMFFMIVVAFGGLVAYDMHTNNRLDTQEETNYPWSDNWNSRDNPSRFPGTIQPEVKQQIVANDYQDAIKKSGEMGMPVFVYFEADWCSWCKKMKSETLSDTKVRVVLKNYIVVYVDTDKSRRIASQHDVRSLPSYVITNYREDDLKKGQGFRKASEFESWLSNPNMYEQPKQPENRIRPERQNPDRRWPDRQRPG